MTDPGVFAEPDLATPRTSDLDALQERISRAIATVEDLGAAHAATLAAKAAADARAKRWADLAYEMWDLLIKARPPEGVGVYARWQLSKNDLRRRLLDMLDDRPEEPTP